MIEFKVGDLVYDIQDNVYRKVLNIYSNKTDFISVSGKAKFNFYTTDQFDGHRRDFIKSPILIFILQQHEKKEI